MQINHQTPEKLDRQINGSLDVHGIFPTMQGEGPYAGTRALFVRLAGCNLQCSYCDTDYTSQRERIDYETLVDKVISLWHPGELVVITGGHFSRTASPIVKSVLYAVPRRAESVSA